MISSALAATTQLLGFAMFIAAQRASAFDQRLISAGSPARAAAGQTHTLNVFAALVAAYAAVWMRVYWPMQQVLLMGLGVYLAGLLYGAIGLCLALFLPGELEGTVAILMATNIELALQNPTVSAIANGRLVEFLPLYGAMQTCIGAGFTHTSRCATSPSPWTGQQDSPRFPSPSSHYAPASTPPQLQPPPTRAPTRMTPPSAPTTTPYSTYGGHTRTKDSPPGHHEHPQRLVLSGITIMARTSHLTDSARKQSR